MIAFAARLATKRSTHKCHRHAALVIRGGAIVATGFNHGETHAEVAALKKLWPSERRGTRVLSVRVRRSGSLGLARPCADCEQFMRENGVKAVEYSTSGGLETMKL